MLRAAVLVSGGGTNLQAIIDAVKNGTVQHTELAVVISNNEGAYALARARAFMVLSGTCLVTSLSKVPSISKNNAFLPTGEPLLAQSDAP